MRSPPNVFPTQANNKRRASLRDKTIYMVFSQKELTFVTLGWLIVVPLVYSLRFFERKINLKERFSVKTISNDVFNSLSLKLSILNYVYSLSRYISENQVGPLPLCPVY